MKSNRLVFLLVIVGAAATTHGGERFNYTEVELKGSCPKIKYINNFSFPRIVGWYYEAFSSLTSKPVRSVLIKMKVYVRGSIR